MCSNIIRSVVVTILAFCLFVESLPTGASENDRIVGGQNTTIDRFPYQVSLRSKGRHYCGGTIYRMTIIITAAHCTPYNGLVDDITVVAGSSFSSEIGLERKVYIFLVHPFYDINPTRNDVALLLLNKPLYFSETIQPITLPKSMDYDRAGTKTVVTGWGALSEGGSSTDQLQYVSVYVMTNEECEKKYGEDMIYPDMLCAGVDGGGKDSCQGDSGGPLVAGDVLVGIVSWGYGCARPNYPGVYARVSYFKRWIDDTLKWLDP